MEIMLFGLLTYGSFLMALMTGLGIVFGLALFVLGIIGIVKKCKKKVFLPLPVSIGFTIVGWILFWMFVSSFIEYLPGLYDTVEDWRSLFDNT
ncbi:MAG: hypothetical protein J1F28_10725 [Oscillospiraceae bacterium]|nr:hypothetical protein [Oscillospiraceae bacterium]